MKSCDAKKVTELNRNYFLSFYTLLYFSKVNLALCDLSTDHQKIRINYPTKSDEVLYLSCYMYDLNMVKLLSSVQHSNSVFFFGKFCFSINYSLKDCKNFTILPIEKHLFHMKPFRENKRKSVKRTNNVDRILISCNLRKFAVKTYTLYILFCTNSNVCCIQILYLLHKKISEKFLVEVKFSNVSNFKCIM